MTVEQLIAEVMVLLQQEGRVAYRMLKRRFDIDDDYVEDLKADLIDAKRLAVDEDGKVLVWIGKDEAGKGETAKRSKTCMDSGLRTPDAGHLPIWPSASGLSRRH